MKTASRTKENDFFFRAAEHLIFAFGGKDTKLFGVSCRLLTVFCYFSLFYFMKTIFFSSFVCC